MEHRLLTYLLLYRPDSEHAAYSGSVCDTGDEVGILKIKALKIAL